MEEEMGFAEYPKEHFLIILIPREPLCWSEPVLQIQDSDRPTWNASGGVKHSCVPVYIQLMIDNKEGAVWGQ